jgi:hypothetical protein
MRSPRLRTFPAYLSRPIGGGRTANLRQVYPPKTAPAGADGDLEVGHLRWKRAYFARTESTISCPTGIDNSGFIGSIHECYGDLSDHIFASKPDCPPTRR